MRELSSARRAVKTAEGGPEGLAQTRWRVDKAKGAVGERGLVWWKDGDLDLNCHLVKTRFMRIGPPT